MDYFLSHGKLPKPPIMARDLLSYLRPHQLYRLEAEALRLQAEKWKVEHGG